ncbi:MAG: YgiQ family radical SAM protein [Gammaproteobacteria bacterium]|nr:YgiQ family radical SAM protein [Gammaproteobacteria bacterium]
MHAARNIFAYPRPNPAPAAAPFLPMSRQEMDALGWDSCDIVLVTGDAYVDHPSFGMAIIGRFLEAHGFRVGMIAQPDWQGAADFRRLGRPRLFFGITAGNMDSMVNRYTADRRIRSDDAYTAGGVGGRRPDRSVIVYSQRAREAYGDVPIVIGGIEASLRRIAHFDYWSEKVRRSVLLDSKADLLVFGNAERQLAEIAHRLDAGEPVAALTDLRGTAFVRRDFPEGWVEIDSTSIDEPGALNPPVDPYATAETGRADSSCLKSSPALPASAVASTSAPAGMGSPTSSCLKSSAGLPMPADATRSDSLLVGAVARSSAPAAVEAGPGMAADDFRQEEVAIPGPAQPAPRSPASATAADDFRQEEVAIPGPAQPAARSPASATAADHRIVQSQREVKAGERSRSVIRIPGYRQVLEDPVLYAHASRILHLESNPGNARALVQRHGDVDLWLNPPPIPLTTQEMDAIYELPYQRRPHPAYGEAKIPAYEMIRFSIAIQRGCFGGCTFCSITEHEGRIIQSRSEKSVLREIEKVRDNVPGFTGIISDLGGPTANMYRLACRSRSIEAACRKPSCVYPGICPNMSTDHSALIRLYRKARELPGIRKVLIASGVRYDLATQSPEYVKELAQHHVGGYLKIAPEAVSEGPLTKMMKPGIGAYYRFRELFEQYSKEAGKEQYLIPYFIAAHPGTSEEDMLELALWLKQNGYRADQVQAFLPSPMATATAMYYSGRNPLRRVRRDGEQVRIPRGLKLRRLHKAFLRYHDPENWPVLRDALRRMGRADLIGNGAHQLVPAYQPAGTGQQGEGRRQAVRGRPFRTQHTGLPDRPPRAGGRRRKP